MTSPYTLKLHLLAQELRGIAIEAEGKEYPAPWLKGGGTVTRSANGQFGSGGGASQSEGKGESGEKGDSTQDKKGGAAAAAAKVDNFLRNQKKAVQGAMASMSKLPEDVKAKAASAAESKRVTDVTNSLKEIKEEGVGEAVKKAEQSWKDGKFEEAANGLMSKAEESKNGNVKAIAIGALATIVGGGLIVGGLMALGAAAAIGGPALLLIGAAEAALKITVGDALLEGGIKTLKDPSKGLSPIGDEFREKWDGAKSAGKTMKTGVDRLTGKDA